MLRIIAGVTSSYFVPVFFMKVYPGFRDTFAVSNAASMAICGLASSMAGGIISDTFEKKSFMSKAFVCMTSSFLAFPLMAACCLNQSSFWFSMIMVTGKTLVSAAFTSPAITMIQNTTKHSNQGKVISSYQFYTAISATFAPIIFTKLAKLFGAQANPYIYGYLIAFFGIIGYWGSIPLWWMAGRSYKKHMEQINKRDPNLTLA